MVDNYKKWPHLNFMREIFFIGVVFSLFDELSFDRMSLRRKIEKERESILC